MSETELEYAEASLVQVLETNVLHASDVIFWLDGSSSINVAQMNRINTPLNIIFSQRPGDLSILSTPGKTALWRKPTNEIIDGKASEAQRTRPAPALFNVVGEVRDPTRHYNPLAFDLNAGSGNGIAVVMYPSPLGVKRSPGGSVYGHLFNEDDSIPVAWGLLELEVNVSLGETLTFRSQSDANGDFVISLKRLPPLPESITQYSAVIRVTTGLGNTPDAAPNLTGYVPLEIESRTNVGVFSFDCALTIVPGERTRLSSVNKDYLAVQSA